MKSKPTTSRVAPQRSARSRSRGIRKEIAPLVEGRSGTLRPRRGGRASNKACRPSEAAFPSELTPGGNTERDRINDDETLDHFYRGRILILQKKRGYRFALDAPLLADFIQTRGEEELLDLGAGNGIISLLLSIKPFKRTTAVEIQEDLAGLARRNVVLNGLEDRITIIREDLRKYRPGREFDVVFSNPPYIRKKAGFLSSSPEKSVAKHEVSCDILDMMRAAAASMKRDGRAYFIYPSSRRDDLFTATENEGLRLKKVRYIHPRPGDKSSLFLSEWSFSAGKTRRLLPLVLHEASGAFTPEARDIFEGRPHGQAL
jgi:tRNA1Val (adenine37-N6)-methyltransferase